MRKLCKLAVVSMALAGLAGCGSTPDNDALVLDLQGFDDSGLVQCDSVSADLAQIDVIQGVCDEGTMPTAEPFTETAANVTFQNNQKLDITIDGYSVQILESGVGISTLMTSQTVFGRRCSNDGTRACATGNDCLILGSGLGLCQASTSTVQVLLADFTTKNLIIPSVEPGGKTLNIELKFYGSDVSGADWQATGFIAGTFTNYDNCGCSLNQ